ncbi:MULTISPECIES: hypothetical protein [unclassified Rhizobacter]|uniref:hypothetical protein n=1 Tax=unclassified Rhizobacter TaxID=2640088 RepID=UPI0006F7C7FB|nr:MULTISPECIES: hypothetical protein [unclassified Rhizobacter]KQU78397.1 hypothetical protein ASC88_21600 [Rhizobacter sp. Root29]KQW10917.1 hypothetical protein ASC98_02890 [Rhizobacter sp. Root1238]KRB25263.1 hypothetical protein ASE08_03575 [Rhizobacter sp. Root16D2]
MTTTEAPLIQIARRYSHIGMQVAKAYHQRQAELELDKVLMPERLSTPDGTATSIATLEELRELTATHRQAYQKLMVAFAGEMAKALEELPEAVRDAERDRIVPMLEWQFNAQREFYENRDRWIAAAEQVCELIDERRAKLTFTDDGVLFEADDDLDRFQALMGSLDEMQQREVEQLAQRIERMKRSAAALGMSFSE